MIIWFGNASVWRVLVVLLMCNAWSCRPDWWSDCGEFQK